MEKPILLSDTKNLIQQKLDNMKESGWLELFQRLSFDAFFMKDPNGRLQIEDWIVEYFNT